MTVCPTRSATHAQKEPAILEHLIQADIGRVIFRDQSLTPKEVRQHLKEHSDGFERIYAEGPHFEVQSAGRIRFDAAISNLICKLT